MQKSKLTLYILIALIAGVLMGYVYNVNVINKYNSKINAAEMSIKAIDAQITASADTTTVAYKALKTERVAQVKLRKTNDDIREDKVEYSVF